MVKGKERKEERERERDGRQVDQIHLQRASIAVRVHARSALKKMHCELRERGRNGRENERERRRDENE